MNSYAKTFAVLLGCWAVVILPTPAEDSGNWKLVWSDEFSQTNGSAPDPAKWIYDFGGSGWGNNELETYTDRRENCRIENGSLVIEVRKEKFTGKDGVARDYTSARIKTKTKAAWTFGRIEARIKIPQGQGIWPAFWMLGTNIDAVGWPQCGEIDIMENIGREPSIIHGTIHGPGYCGGEGIGGSYHFSEDIKVGDNFHIFTVEWTTNRISWFVDEKRYFSVTPNSLPAKSRWVFTEPQFLLLNLAVGGSWPGKPDENNKYPKSMLVDYVRVYALIGAGVDD
jgi:beta-glucanase (GH16 family)